MREKMRKTEANGTYFFTFDDIQKPPSAFDAVRMCSRTPVVVVKGKLRAECPLADCTWK
jgi:hypothetical protein